MAGARGYHNYRGRKSKGKAFLAVLLVLVILAAVVVMLLQKHIVYDETGMPRLELLWEKDTAETESNAQIDLDLVIQEPVTESVLELRAFSVKEAPLTLEGWRTARVTAEEICGQNANAAMLIARDNGKNYFDAEAAVVGSRMIGDETAAALAEILQGDTAVEHAIARFSCFHDPIAAKQDVEGMGLKNTGGFIFYDGRNSQWLDPAKPEAREYLCELAKEVAALGFDEILLTDVSYPTEGKLDKIVYGETAKSTNLLTFLEEMKAALEPYSVVLSIEVPTEVLTAGREDTAGLVLAEIAPKVDRIYAPALAENVEALSAVVTAANSNTVFVPELTECHADLEGSWLIFTT